MGANVLIMAGGTGGHVFPALACAREFQDRGYTVHWLGYTARYRKRTGARMPACRCI